MRLRLKQTHLFYFAELSPNQLSLSFSKLENLFLCFPLLESNNGSYGICLNLSKISIQLMYGDGINYNLSKIDEHFVH